MLIIISSKSSMRAMRGMMRWRRRLMRMKKRESPREGLYNKHVSYSSVYIIQLKVFEQTVQ